MERGAPAQRDVQVVDRDQAHAAAHEAQTPSASTMVRSMAKPMLARGAAELALFRVGAGFGDAAAQPADQKRRAVGGVGMRAGREGVQPAHLVHEPLLHQEIERAVGDGRLGLEAVIRQPLEDLVGAERAIRFEQDGQRAPSARRQAPAFRGAAAFGLGQRQCDIVGGFWFLQHYIITSIESDDRIQGRGSP
jgi:hypothetical protein